MGSGLHARVEIAFRQTLIVGVGSCLSGEIDCSSQGGGCGRSCGVSVDEVHILWLKQKESPGRLVYRVECSGDSIASVDVKNMEYLCKSKYTAVHGMGGHVMAWNRWPPTVARRASSIEGLRQGQGIFYWGSNPEGSNPIRVLRRQASL